MQNIHALSLILFTSCAAYTMEQQQLALPDWEGTYQLLQDDYPHYVKAKLEQYKEADISTWNVGDLEKIGKIILPNQYIGKRLEIVATTVDEDNNSFLHYAVEKNDAKTFDGLLCFSRPGITESNRNFNAKNGSRETPFDLCIKKLSPHIPAEERAVAEKIFEALVSHIKELRHCSHAKKEWLDKIIALQLHYIDCGSSFTVDQNVLERLVPGYQRVSLFEYYVQVTAKKC